MNWLGQILSVTRFGLQTIPARKGTSAAAVFGIAGVVAVFVGVLSIANGVARTMAVSSTEESAIVLRTGATDEMLSALSGESVRIIADAPGVARGDDGALASGELFVIINLANRSTGTDANVPLRGVEPAAFHVREGFEVMQGRKFQWGRKEVMVGRGAAGEFAGLDLGADMEIGGDLWQIVGVFATGGGVAESEIWTDAAVLQPAYRRGNSFQSVRARLESPESYQEFKDALTTDPRLEVKVIRESDYYAEQSALLINLITGLGTLVAGLMAIGAVFGALNTMYSTVSARTREIATLRALGFGATPVVISILVEAVVLALLGGVIGGGTAYLAFDGFRAATLNWSSFAQIAFAFDVSPELLIRGTLYAALIGLIGGFLPAVRAARLPVATALREQ